MGAVHVNIFHGVDISAAGLVPNLKVAILFGHAKPSSAYPFRGCDIEIPPSGKRTIAFLRKGMRREDACHRGCDHHGQRREQRHPNRFLHRNPPSPERYASARLSHGTRPFKTRGRFGSRRRFVGLKPRTDSYPPVRDSPRQSRGIGVGNISLSLDCSVCASRLGFRVLCQRR